MSLGGFLIVLCCVVIDFVRGSGRDGADEHQGVVQERGECAAGLERGVGGG